MKIIAISKNGYDKKFLVECSKDELIALARGRIYDGEYQPDIGHTFDVHSIFKRVERLGHCQDDLMTARKILRGLADALEPLGDVVSKPASTAEETVAKEDGAA